MPSIPSHGDTVVCRDAKHTGCHLEAYKVYKAYSVSPDGNVVYLYLHDRCGSACKHDGVCGPYNTKRFVAMHVPEFIPVTKKHPCDCPIEVLMGHGCQCGRE